MSPSQSSSALVRRTVVTFMLLAGCSSNTAADVDTDCPASPPPEGRACNTDKFCPYAPATADPCVSESLSAVCQDGKWVRAVGMPAPCTCPASPPASGGTCYKPDQTCPYSSGMQCIPGGSGLATCTQGVWAISCDTVGPVGPVGPDAGDAARESGPTDGAVDAAPFDCGSAPCAGQDVCVASAAGVHFPDAGTPVTSYACRPLPTGCAPLTDSSCGPNCPKCANDLCQGWPAASISHDGRMVSCMGG